MKLQIDFKQKELLTVPVSELEPGEVFEIDGEIFIMEDVRSASERRDFRAIRLMTKKDASLYVSCKMSPDGLVHPVKSAKLLIEP